VADLTDAQRKRAEARQRRRSKKDDAPGEPEAPADGAGEEPHHAVKQAAKVAAAVGAAGAAAAAARALTSHSDEDEEADAPEHEDPQAESDEPQAENQKPEAESRKPQQQEQPEEQEEQREEEVPAEEPVAGAEPSDARKVIDRAREQLQDLLERPVESVSSLERTHDGWVAQLEVVELKRVPESTDVLASYELELDDELNLRRYQQARRYTRSRVSQGEGS
jgi:Gas vesicle synthesis protein GvpO